MLWWNGWKREGCIYRISNLSFWEARLSPVGQPSHADKWKRIITTNTEKAEEHSAEQRDFFCLFLLSSLSFSVIELKSGIWNRPIPPEFAWERDKNNLPLLQQPLPSISRSIGRVIHWAQRQYPVLLRVWPFPYYRRDLQWSGFPWPVRKCRGHAG